jgi:hypothetical protein
MKLTNWLTFFSTSMLICLQIMHIGFLIFWLVVKYLLKLFWCFVWRNFKSMIMNKSSNLKFDHHKIVFNLTKQVINILNKFMKNINSMFLTTSACNISFLINFLLFIIFTFFRFIFLLICSSYYLKSVFINAQPIINACSQCNEKCWRSKNIAQKHL